MKARQGYKLVQGIPRYIKFEIPEDWNFPALQDVCNTTSGGTPLTDHPEYYDGEIPWLTTSELQDNFVSETKYKITEAGLKNSSAKKIPPNSTIIAMYGATISKTCINTKEMTTNQACCVLIPKKEKLVDTYFLQQILIYFRSLIVSLGEGAGQPNISQDFLKKFQIPFPLYQEQQKIISILSNVDAQMQQTQKLIDLTQRLKKGLMQKLLTRGIGHTKFKKIPWYFGKDIEIPEEWEVVKFRSMIKMEYGSGLTEEKRDNFGNPVYGSGGLIGLHSKPIVNGPGIIVARKGSLGNVFFENDDFFPIDTVYYITEKQTEIDLQFLFYYLLHMKLENLRIVTSKPGISRDDVYSYRILSIPLPEQQKIASILLNVDEQIQQHKNEKALLERIKKGLMQQLLTGQRRVKVGV